MDLLLAQKAASLDCGNTSLQRPTGLPECLQVINQASKQLNQIPSLHPDKSTFLRKDPGPTRWLAPAQAPQLSLCLLFVLRGLCTAD